MTKIKNGILFIESEPDDKCEYCGKIDELRPYGKNGARICFECGMKPENKKTTDENFIKMLSNVKSINIKNN